MPCVGLDHHKQTISTYYAETLNNIAQQNNRNVDECAQTSEKVSDDLCHLRIFFDQRENRYTFDYARLRFLVDKVGLDHLVVLRQRIEPCKQCRI